MIPKKQFLDQYIFDMDTLEQLPTRDGFGHALVDAGKKDKRIVALCADLAESTRVHWFQEQFPDRYVELGVAEQNMMTVASGMANYGKIPFITSYATFSPGRNWEQMRTTVCLNNVPVKIIGSHAGVSVGPDGATHQALEDIALTRVLPNMTVIVPADSNEAYKATRAVAQTESPAYIRLAREKTPVFTTDKTPFEVGKASVVYESENAQIGIIACGALVYQSILAAEMLRSKGISVSVMNLSTIKPLDVHGIVKFAQTVDRIVTAEEHQIAGGMGSAVAECLSQHYPITMSFIGIHDEFGQSGTSNELFAHYGLDARGIVNHITSLI